MRSEEQLKIFNRSDYSFVRGVAVIFLMFHHLFISENVFTQYGVSSVVFSNKFMLYIGMISKCCVGIFAFLSAYGMVKRERIDVWRYSLHRLLKLLSAFWFAFIIANILFINKIDYIATYGDKKLDMLYYVFVDFMGLSTIFGTPTINRTWWYMSLAITMIFAVPLLSELYNRINKIILVLVFLFSFYWQLLFPDLCYLGIPFFAVAIGVCCAKENWIEKIVLFKEGSKKSSLIKGVLSIVLLIIMFVIRAKLGFHVEAVIFTEGIIGLIISAITVTVFRRIRPLYMCLKFVGNNSANIFFLHSMFLVFYPQYIYVKYLELSVVILLAVSLIVSVVVEWIKKIVRYQKLIEKIEKTLGV